MLKSDDSTVFTNQASLTFFETQLAQGSVSEYVMKDYLSQAIEEIRRLRGWDDLEAQDTSVPNPTSGPTLTGAAKLPILAFTKSEWEAFWASAASWALANSPDLVAP